MVLLGRELVVRIHRQLVVTRQAVVHSDLHRLHVIEHPNAELLHLPFLRRGRKNVRQVVPLPVNLAEVTELMVHIQLVVALVHVPFILLIEVIIQSPNKARIALHVVVLILPLQTQPVFLLPVLFLKLSLLVEALEPRVHLRVAHQVLAADPV